MLHLQLKVLFDELGCSFWLLAKPPPMETCMRSLRPAEVSPQTVADNSRDWEGTEVQGWLALPEDNEVGERFEPALIARLRAEIAEAHRNFDVIVRRLGYGESQSK